MECRIKDHQLIGRVMEEQKFTEKEMIVLSMMFQIVQNVLNAQDGYMEIKHNSFDGNDLYDLAQKLGIDDY